MVTPKEQLAARFRPAHFARLKHLAVFAMVVDSGSFTAAGRRLGIARSAISRYVSELEAHFGVSLLRRSTRSLSLTATGERLFFNCTRLVNAAVDSVDSIGPDAGLMGSITVAAPLGYGHNVLVPALRSFMGLHPELNIQLRLNDQFVDLVENGIDLGIRVGSRGTTPNYMSRKIGEMRYRLFAQRDFVERHGGIKTPEKAEELPWILGLDGPNPSAWDFSRAGKRSQINVMSQLGISDISARIKAASLGMGLVGALEFMVSDFTPDFVEVLGEYKIEPKIPIYAVYPSTRFVSPRIAQFLTHLQTRRTLSPVEQNI